uniref:Uncharacterized protein n=1 Tax=Lactuca sativa TaxID=4236 RepID=A0A9R1VF54_LACSA|nr:hypothetical protein LSAT_V11C500270540 [Lactuca sativa]
MVQKPITQLKTGHPSFICCFNWTRKNWKNEVKYDINSLNKKFDLLLSSLGKEKCGQKICVSYGNSGHIADECMRSQEEINQVHDYGQFQNSPQSFNRNYNQGAGTTTTTMGISTTAVKGITKTKISQNSSSSPTLTKVEHQRRRKLIATS